MSTFQQRLMLRLVNIWPPMAGAGIRVRWGADLKSVDVELKLRFWNRNYVGTHYGGSLYSMTDPFYMLMLMNNLGPGYIVWDKAAAIRFRKPGKGQGARRVSPHRSATRRYPRTTEHAAEVRADLYGRSERRSGRSCRGGTEGAAHPQEVVRKTQVAKQKKCHAGGSMAHKTATQVCCEGLSAPGL